MKMPIEDIYRTMPRNDGRPYVAYRSAAGDRYSRLYRPALTRSVRPNRPGGPGTTGEHSRYVNSMDPQHLRRSAPSYVHLYSPW